MHSSQIGQRVARAFNERLDVINVQNTVVRETCNQIPKNQNDYGNTRTSVDVSRDLTMLRLFALLCSHVTVRVISHLRVLLTVVPWTGIILDRELEPGLVKEVLRST